MFDETENTKEQPDEELLPIEPLPVAEAHTAEIQSDVPECGEVSPVCAPTDVAQAETEATANSAEPTLCEAENAESIAAFLAESPLDAVQGLQPETPAAVLPKKKSNVGGVIMLILLFLAVAGFSVFCIMQDIKKGTPSGGYMAGDVVEVKLIQNPKPVTSEKIRDENGRYTVAGIAETVMPSIVKIYAYSHGVQRGLGSGIILTENGYIVTNSHVLADAEAYEVIVGESEKYQARMIGHDSKTDIAILKVDASGLTPASLGNSDEMQLGEEVCALGNPAGFTASISSGVISGLKRSIQVEQTKYAMECFQTDAAISPGNSGGALVNRYGDVIGITSSKYGSSILSGGDYEGLGFAITINAALPIIKELIEQGYVGGRVRIGIRFYDVDVMKKMEDMPVPEELKDKGILVMNVDEDSDLAQTTFKVGDWILEMNGQAVCDYDTVVAAIAGLTGGDRVHAHCATVDDNGDVIYYEIDFTLMNDTSGDY